MDLHKAITYIQQNGNLVEIARLSSILWAEPPSEEVFKELEKLQKADGGFAYWCPQVSNLCDTAYILQWLDDLRSYDNEIAQKACHFLLERQLQDAGWDEVPEVVHYPCPEWMIPVALQLGHG